MQLPYLQAILFTFIFLSLSVVLSIGSAIANRVLASNTKAVINKPVQIEQPLLAEDFKQSFDLPEPEPLETESELVHPSVEPSPVTPIQLVDQTVVPNSASSTEPVVESPSLDLLATRTFRLSDSKMTSVEQSNKYQADTAPSKMEGGMESHKRHREEPESKMDYDISSIGVVGHDEASSKESERLASAHAAKRQKTDADAPPTIFTASDSLFVALGRQKAKGLVIKLNVLLLSC